MPEDRDPFAPIDAPPPPGGEPPAGEHMPSDEPEGDAPERSGSFLRELPILILIAFGLALLLKTFLIQAFYIPSGSMEPTLQVEDRILVNKLVYRFREPRRGEIIVFAAERSREERSFPSKLKAFFTEGLGFTVPAEKDFIKRVIGLPGETVEMDARGRVFITPAGGGERFRLREPYLDEQRDRDPFGPEEVPEDAYFVMGDNRANSSDSRSSLGPIRREDIIGKAFVRLWPLGRVGFFRTPGYGAPAEGVSEGDATGPGPLGPGPLGTALGVSFAPWSPTVVSRRGCARRGSGSWRGWTRPVAARSPARWSRAR